MGNRRHDILLIALAIVAILAVALVARLAADAPATTPAAATTGGFAPISYFAQHCARCHGPYGSFYGDDFGKNLPPDELRQIIRQMAEGPGNAPPDERQLDALLAFHRSLIDKRPFIALTQSAGGKSQPLTLTGEVTPGATVAVTGGGQSTLATVTDHAWTATLPAGPPLAAVRIVATKDGREMVLEAGTGERERKDGN